MAIGFIIPAGSIITSPAHPAANTTIRPDKSFTNVFKPRVHLATFGDGYEQRLEDGINSVQQEFTVQFNKREKEEINDITAFLESLKGATSFNFTIPDTNSSGDERTLRVVCDNFQQSYDYGDYYSCSAKFRRVYEA